VVEPVEAELQLFSEDSPVMAGSMSLQNLSAADERVAVPMVDILFTAHSLHP